MYDWYGSRLLKRQIPGEINGQPYDNVYRENDLYARALDTWRLHRANTLRLSSALAYADRNGKDRLFASTTTRDPLSARNRRVTLVSGLEWELDAWGRARPEHRIRQGLRFSRRWRRGPSRPHLRTTDARHEYVWRRRRAARPAALVALSQGVLRIRDAAPGYR